MEIVNKYFKDKVKDISFIQLKDEVSIGINNFVIKSDLPLPVVTDNLIKDLKEGKLNNEINMDSFIEGMIYLLGVDDGFIHLNEYREILKAYNPNINDYILYKGLDYMEKSDLDNGAIYLRALLLLDPKNVNGLFNYGIALEEMAKGYIEEDLIDLSDSFLILSTSLFESILDIEEDFSLAYYKLGFHYKHFQEYLKASLIWGKFLTLDKDHLRLEEIREEIEIIDDEVNFETGLTYLNYKDYGKALEFLLKLMPRHEENWNTNYLLGLSYSGLENFELAKKYLEIALELNQDEPELYNELGIILFTEGNIAEAISIFGKGIENCEKDYKLYFNRALGYIELEEYEKALKDFDKAYLINPEDENIQSQRERVEAIMSNS